MTERAHAQRPDDLEIVQSATGIFMTGGNQLRLSTILGGTQLAQAIRRCNAQGVPVAGTSAGAAIMPEHMIAGGASGPTPTADGVLLAPGLGLTNSLSSTSTSGSATASGACSRPSRSTRSRSASARRGHGAVLDADDTFEVYGSGAVTIVDPADLVYSSMDSARAGEPVNLVGLFVHILAAGLPLRHQDAHGDVPPRVPFLDEDEDPSRTTHGVRGRFGFGTPDAPGRGDCRWLTLRARLMRLVHQLNPEREPSSRCPRHRGPTRSGGTGTRTLNGNPTENPNGEPEPQTPEPPMPPPGGAVGRDAVAPVAEP